jgi:hypothetical protein
MAEDNNGMIVLEKKKTTTLTIALPKEGDIEATRILMEQKLEIDVGDLFVPFKYDDNAPSGVNFGPLGRRWCVKIIINSSDEENFYLRLREFCKKYNIVLNENPS